VTGGVDATEPERPVTGAPTIIPAGYRYVNGTDPPAE